MPEAGEPPVRILLVEDHTSFRQALAFSFNLDPALEVIAEAGSLADARAFLERADAAVDVAVLDLELPDGDGATLIPLIHTVNAGATVMVLTGSINPAAHASAIQAGAAGLLHKSARLSEIVDKLKRSAAGESILSARELLEISAAARRSEIAPDPTLPALTRREQDVLAALAEGLNDQQIAAILFVGKETVRTHMERIMRKLGASSRTQALILAIRSGLVDVS